MSTETTAQLDEMRAKALCALGGGDDDTWDDFKEQFLEQARAVRLADEAAGIVSVPREPTKKMAFDGGCTCPRDSWFEFEENAHERAGKGVWRAMLDASPFRKEE